MTVEIDPDDALLEAHAAIGTFADCLLRADISGPFDNYLFCAANGRQVLLGHEWFPGLEKSLTIISSTINRRSGPEQVSVNHVFVSRGNNYNRSVYTVVSLIYKGGLANAG